MAFPNTPTLDDFNRADSGSLGASWLDQPESGYLTLSVRSNQCGLSAGGSFQGNYWATQFGGNQEMFCTIAVLAVDRIRLYLRLQSPGLGTFSCYKLDLLSTTNHSLDAYVAGSLNFIANPTMTVANGDVIGMSHDGSALNVWQNGTSVFSTTDTQVTGNGYIGMHMANDTSMRIDNFGGGTVTAALQVPGPDQYPPRHFGPF